LGAGQHGQEARQKRLLEGLAYLGVIKFAELVQQLNDVVESALRASEHPAMVGAAQAEDPTA
jgi:hypothetical protein